MKKKQKRKLIINLISTNTMCFLQDNLEPRLSETLYFKDVSMFTGVINYQSYSNRYDYGTCFPLLINLITVLTTNLYNRRCIKNSDVIDQMFISATTHTGTKHF